MDGNRPVIRPPPGQADMDGVDTDGVGVLRKCACAQDKYAMRQGLAFSIEHVERLIWGYESAHLRVSGGGHSYGWGAEFSMSLPRSCRGPAAVVAGPPWRRERHRSASGGTGHRRDIP